MSWTGPVHKWKTYQKKVISIIVYQHWKSWNSSSFPQESCTANDETF